MQARTHHEVDGVEDTAIVVRDAARDGGAPSPCDGRSRVDHDGSPRRAPGHNG
jgi:hypothetical protein